MPQTHPPTRPRGLTECSHTTVASVAPASLSLQNVGMVRALARFLVAVIGRLVLWLGPPWCAGPRVRGIFLNICARGRRGNFVGGAPGGVLRCGRLRNRASKASTLSW